MRKNIMTLLATMLLCLAMASTAMAAEPGIISVDGSGEYTLAPDKAVICLSVESREKTVELARANNAAQSAKLSAALSRLGIYSKDIQSHYSLYPVYDKGKVVDYLADNSFEVTVTDLDKLSTVVDTSLANGATGVSGFSYGLKDEVAAKNEALSRAVGDARNKADTIARALGVNIIGIRTVTEGSSMNPGYRTESAQLMTLAKNDAAATPVLPGMVSFTAGVHIEYQIQ